MRKEVALALLGCSSVLFLTGCDPELAQVPVGQEEKSWDKILKDNYYSFRPPHTPAPASYQPAAAPAAPVEQQGVPEAAEDPVSIVDRAAASEKKAEPAKSAAPVEQKAGEKSKEAAPAAVDGGKAENTAKPETRKEFTKPYIVQSGDSLGRIALRFYGKSSMEDVIYKANSSVISDRNKLRPGMKLVIPEL